jgi:hypothetical protein
VDIIISEKGLGVLKKLDSDMLGADLLRENITEEEATQLNEILDKIRG